MHTFHRHLKAASHEHQVTYGQVLLEAQSRFRRLCRRHEACLEWLNAQLVHLNDALASDLAFSDKKRSTTYRQYLVDSINEKGARRAHALTRLEDPVQLSC
jgi:hypothetical protein